MQIEQAIVIRASPEATFLFAARPENMPLWNPAVLRSELLGTMEPGATVVQVAQICGRRFDIVYGVTHYEPFRRVKFSSVSGPMDIEGTMSFRGERRGTSLRWVVRGDCRGFLHVTERVLRAVGRHEMGICLRRLKGLVEAENAPTGSRTLAAS